jgi:hypothetical protein
LETDNTTDHTEAAKALLQLNAQPPQLTAEKSRPPSILKKRTVTFDISTTIERLADTEPLAAVHHHVAPSQLRKAGPPEKVIQLDSEDSRDSDETIDLYETASSSHNEDDHVLPPFEDSVELGLENLPSPPESTRSVTPPPSPPKRGRKAGNGAWKAKQVIQATKIVKVHVVDTSRKSPSLLDASSTDSSF